MGIYQWVWFDQKAGKRFYDVGILDDGSLHSPNGYLESAVHAAVLAADTRKHERRKQAAKKAAVTRARRRELKVDWIARRIVEKQQTGPQSHCHICGRGLSDPPSIERGIGSECWQDVLAAIERYAAQAA